MQHKLEPQHDLLLAHIATTHNDLAKILIRYERMKDLLEELRDYHDDRADADCEDGHFIPNDDMSILMRIDEVLA